MYKSEVQDDCQTCRWRTSRFFCGVSGTALRHLQRIAALEFHPAGAVLYAEAQLPKGVYILCNGRAKISTTSSRGKIIILKIAQPGEVLGLGAALAQRPHEETATLLDSCQLKFIPKRELSSYLSGNASASLKSALQVNGDCDAAREQIRRISSSISGRQKLAQLLISWNHEASFHDDSQGVVPVPYTHEEIAQMIGSTRETVTRALNRFRKERAIEVRSGTFMVKDLKRLAQFGGD
jgi:CRP/FNR family transcriptional regulator